MEVFKTIEKLYNATAEYIVATAKDAIAERGKFIISLSGGETPKGFYSLLSTPDFSNQIEWNKTFIFWGDERCVPLDDERNNAYQAKSILLDKVDIPAINIYRIPVNLPPEEAASTYEKELKSFFENRPIHFDIILLGLGENGHTASIFPGTKVIHEYKEGVRAVFVEEEKTPARASYSGEFRITLTAYLINQARHILFLVTGEKKAEILKNVLSVFYQPNKYPAQLIKPTNGELLWFVDSAAAALISDTTNLKTI